MEHLIGFLREIPLFQSFSEASLDKLLQESRVGTFEPQQTIIEFGQPGRFLGVVLEGEAEAQSVGAGGLRKKLGSLKPGDMLGEMSLLTGEPTSADVVAVRRSQILMVPQEAFSILMAAHPGAVRVMARTITDRFRSRQQDEEARDRVGEAWRSTPDRYGLSLSTATPARILVINCGSSSLKFSYFDTERQEDSLDGTVERIGLENARVVCSSRRGKVARELGPAGYGEAFEAVVALITDPEIGAIKDVGEISAVGHRVVHGGQKYSGATLIDEQVIADIDALSSLAPLHNPPNLMAIRASMALMPGVPQVAVFDTGFHQKLPPHSYLYGLPYEMYEKEGVRRYGFHGISHNYVGLKAAEHLKQDFNSMKIITCHLGNGASVCAIEHGRSVDTSMGFTPLEGLIMGTRCGDLDPSIVLHLCRDKGMSPAQVDDILNRRSGLKGLSGISSDFRMLAEAADKGDPRALLTIHAFCYRIRKYIGAYVAALGGLDALVFTGGIGEGSGWVRALACNGLPYIGIQVDQIRNRTVSPSPGQVVDVSAETSRVRVLVVPTDEARMIARETIRALGYERAGRAIQHQEEKEIPVEVSAHHVHLSRSAVEALFGPGHELTHRSDLSQPGQFACQETVNLVGPNGRVERVRVLGPVRGETQVEISMTEEYKLGIKAPIRASGDLDGSPGLALEGPRGTLELPQGVVCALRHIHMSPEDALQFGLKDRDTVMVQVRGGRTLVYGDVLVRVHPEYRLAMHIDTDEANAAGIATGMIGHLTGVQDRR